MNNTCWWIFFTRILWKKFEIFLGQWSKRILWIFQVSSLNIFPNYFLLKLMKTRRIYATQIAQLPPYLLHYELIFKELSTLSQKNNAKNYLSPAINYINSVGIALILIVSSNYSLSAYKNTRLASFLTSLVINYPSMVTFSQSNPTPR